MNSQLELIPVEPILTSWDCVFFFSLKKWNSFTAAGEQLKSNCGASSSVIVDMSACLPFQPPTSLDLLLHLEGLLLGLPKGVHSAGWAVAPGSWEVMGGKLLPCYRTALTALRRGTVYLTCVHQK